MVKAYSRYNESGAIGLIHADAAGSTVSWSNSGKSIFSASGTHVVEINVKTGTQVASVSCTRKTLDEGMYGSTLSLRQPARASSIACDSEHLVVGCTDGSLRVLQLPLGEDERQVASFHGHRGSINAIAMEKSAGLIATGGRDTEIVVWDIVAEAGICRLTGHKGEITALSFLPGNCDFLVSSSKDGLVKIWSIKLQICVQTLTDSKSEAWSIAFHGKDRLIVGSSDKVLYVYRINSNLIVGADGLSVAEFHGQLDRPEPADGRIDSIGVSDGVIFAQTDRRVIEMWRIVSGMDEKTKRMKRRVKRADRDIDQSFKATDEYVIASAPESPSVALRYIANAKIKTMSVCPIVMGNIHMVALGLGDNQIELFKLSSETDLFSIKETRAIKREGHRNSVEGLAVSSDGNRLISISTESIIIWNAVSLAFQKMVYSPSGEVVDAFFVPGDSDRVVMITKDSHCCVVDINSGGIVGTPIRLWESGDEEETSVKKRKKNTGLNEVKCVSHYIPVESPSGGKLMILIGEKDRKLTSVQLDCEKFEIVSSHDLPDEPVCVTISPKTNKYFAVGLMSSNVELIYTDTGKHFMSLYSHKLAVSAVAFSPDEQVVVSGSSDKNIKVWSTKFGNVLKSIRAHDNGITRLVFIPQTHLMFSTSRDGVLSLWDIDRFERVLSKVNHPSAEVLALATSPDAGMVFTSGSDRAIKRITRGDDQMFIEEEQEKAMELDVDGEAQRGDITGADGLVPTKSSLESVRLVERVAEMIEIDEAEMDTSQVLQKKKDLVKFIATELPPSDLQQVIVSLPTGHARRLLSVIAEVMDAVIIQSNGVRRFPAGFPTEQCVSAGLFLIQAQAKYLMGEPHSRQVLLKLKDLFHFAIKKEIENVGVAAASIKFF
jgi:U3 small nucleolar RNA-associated protein 12